MFIIWGSKARQEMAGAVADRCATCQEIRAFHVKRHYKVGHLYYIPLGRGTLQGVGRVCTQCGTEFRCEPETYDELVPIRERKDMSLDELIARTNARLVDALVRQADLEALAEAEAERIGDDVPGDARLALALEKLAPFQESDGGEALMKALERWPELTPAARDALLEGVETFAEGASRVEQAMGFVSLAAKSYPEYAGCGPAGGLLLLLCSPIIFVPFLQNWIAGPIVVFVALMVSFIVLGRSGRAAIRSWVRLAVVPQAEQRSIDYAAFVSILASVDTSDKGIDEKVREMAGAIEVIVATLLELDKLDESMFESVEPEVAGG